MAAATADVCVHTTRTMASTATRDDDSAMSPSASADATNEVEGEDPAVVAATKETGSPGEGEGEAEEVASRTASELAAEAAETAAAREAGRSLHVRLKRHRATLDVNQLVSAEHVEALGAEFQSRTLAKGDGLSCVEFVDMMLNYLPTDDRRDKSESWWHWLSVLCMCDKDSHRLLCAVSLGGGRGPRC